ncbi:MAG: helicase [Methylobacteriaceae bacterium]|nr:helicase [Methylobacteriaceae bacterium]
MNVSLPNRRTLDRAARARGVTALLGPTNTGKTHYAIERMLAHSSGAIGLPLRLLAREVYNRVVAKAGPERVALITGEEKIKPAQPAYWISTVEAMPRDLDVAFVAIDEVQLAADLDRGHVFTDRLLNRRGRDETLLIGAGTMRDIIVELMPGAHVTERPRLSSLAFAGDRKLTRLPRRSAIVAFSAEDVYAIAELIRRQRGGAAVVLGALSPRTRNAQVELYQNGEVDYLVATDAIGMGLNLDVDHIAFAADRKFDGWQHRRLTPAEFGQIAGRAGRNQRDGTFGTTGRCPPFDEELVERLQEHRFDAVRTLQWRNADLDFSSIERLQQSLERLPREDGLTRAPLAEDVMVLDIAAHDERVRREAKTPADVARLWDACQIPDYRKVSPAAHAELALSVYRFVVRAGRIPDDWFAAQLFGSDRVDGDIDALSRRIAQVRTCTYIANRPDWLGDPAHWQGLARQVEDRLSDALHERLAQRFVDRRTSVLMRRLRENAMLDAQINAGGDVIVEGQHVGQLHGFRFTPDPQASGEAARALNAAAQKALAGEIEARAERVHQAVDDAFALANDGAVRWLGEIVGKIAAGDKLLGPRVQVLADEQLSGAALEKVQRRLDLWLAQLVTKRLGPLLELEKGEGLEGVARGLAYQIAESLGVLDRARVAEEVRGLDQDARAALRKLGVRFGAYHIYLPALLKPAPRALAAQLWALKHGGVEQMKGFDEVPHLAASGRTSFAAPDADAPKGLYRAAGFRVGGGRAVRVDILERLADLIRPAIAYRPGVTAGTPPAGAADGDGFVVTVAMTSLAGCSGEDFANILRSLGYAVEKRKGPAITVPLLAPAPVEPIKPKPAEAPEGEATTDAPGEGETVAADASADVADVEAPAPEAEAPTPAVVEAEAPAAEAAAPVEPPVDAAPEAITADAAPDGAPETPAEPEAVVAEAPAVEDVLIEVWRPHRHHQHGRRPEGRQGRRPDRRPERRRDGEAAPAVAAEARPAGAPGEGEARREGRPPRREGRHGERRDGGRARPQGARPQGERPHGERPQGERPQGERPQGERPQGERPQGERPRGDRPQGDRPKGPRRDGRPEREERGPRRDDRPGGRATFSSEPPRRDRQPDPDSPFAKLAALKAKLEGRE